MIRLLREFHFNNKFCILIMAAFEDGSIRPYFKADSGAFGGDLKMPLLVGQPGRRPGDFCLDDVAGLVRVRRGDQSVLNLGGGGSIPTWSQTVLSLLGLIQGVLLQSTEILHFLFLLLFLPMEEICLFLLLLVTLMSM